MTKTLRKSLAILLAASATCLAGSGGFKFPEEKVPELNVPKMTNKPTIDGRIDPDEWRESVKVMGVVRSGSLGYKDRPVSFRVAWDENHLFIAAKSDILPGHRMWRQRRERFTTGVVYDDAYEFGIFMHDRNKLEGEVSSFLKFIVNSLGAGEYMKLYPSIGQNMYNWQPDPELANAVYEADGREWWSLEMAFDLEDLQMPVQNKPGDRIDMLLAADLKNPKWQWLDFPSATGHLEHYGFPRMRLTESEPYIQVHKIGGLHDEKIELDAEIINPSEKPATVEAEFGISYNPPPESDLAEKTVVDVNETLTIPANAATPFNVSKTFPGLKYTETKWGAPENASTLHFLVRRKGVEDAAVVYKYHAEFAGTDKSYLDAVPRTTPFVASASFNPASNTLFLSGDTLDAQIPESTKPAAMAYEVTMNGETVAAGRSDLLINYKYDATVRLTDPQPGKYRVKAALVDKNGRELVAKNDITFEKKDEAQAFDEWWNSDYGDTDRILKPYAPIQVDGNRATVTRRVYEFDGLGLPRQIEANGGPVLTAPARIVVTVDGKEYVVPTDGSISYTDKKDWRTEFTGGPIDVAGIEFTANGWMEQDGLVHLDITYAPVGSLAAAGPAAAVLIEDLRVEWPVESSDGAWMSCIGGVGGNYAPRTIGKVPEGDGQVWNTLDDIGKAGSLMLIGNWQSNLWVGDIDRGLCWFGDDDQGWVPTDQTPAHSLYREGDAVIIRNHIIHRSEGAEPFELTEARTINLLYNATPFRNFAPSWRLTQVSAANGFSAPDWKFDEDEEKDYFTILSMPSKNKDKWPYYLEKYKKIANAKAEDGLYRNRPRLHIHLNNQIALRGYGPKTREPGVYDYFRADWATQFAGESLNQTYRDYMLYLMNMHVRDGGLAHYYFDISFTRSTPALNAGFGYRLPDGRVQPGSMDDTLREWYKRVWALMQEYDLYPGGVSGHATHSIPLRALPWADAILDSEYPMKDPVTVYTKDAMIAMSTPHNFGVNINHLGFMKPVWASLFDSSQGGSGFPFSDPAFRHFGITAGDVEFLPFWRNGNVIEPADDGVLASAWKRPDKVIIQVLNYGLDPEGEEKTRSAALNLDLRALGVPANINPAQLHIRELEVAENRVAKKYSSFFDWYDDLLESPRWGNDTHPRIRPPAAPTITLDGKVEGVHLYYHDARFLEITWSKNTVDISALMEQVGSENVDEALAWGVDRAETATESVKPTTADEVEVRAWKQPGTAMIAVHNPTDERITPRLSADIDALGVKVEERWKAFTQLYEADGNTGEYSELPAELPHRTATAVQRGQAAFNGYDGTLIVPLAPGEKRLLFIDTYAQ